MINFEDPELLESRRAIWTSAAMRYEDADPWITLAPQRNLRDYEELLTTHYGCDDQALGPFVSLATNGPDGYMEACRLIYHMIKDKKAFADPSAGPADPHYYSKWLKRASDRALQDLSEPWKWNAGDPSLTGKGAEPTKGSCGSYKGSYKGHQGQPKGKDEAPGQPMNDPAWGNYIPRPSGSWEPEQHWYHQGSSSASSPHNWTGYR